MIRTGLPKRIFLLTLFLVLTLPSLCLAVFSDMVAETTTTTGTGTISLAGAVSGYRTFVAGVGDGNTCTYQIKMGTEWEIGTGTVTDGAPDTLSRDTVHSSSNAGALVNFSAGTKTVQQVLSASDLDSFLQSDDLTAIKIILGVETETTLGLLGRDASGNLTVGDGAARNTFVPEGEDANYEPAFSYGTGAGEIDATDIPVNDTEEDFTGGNVETVLHEIQDTIDALPTGSSGMTRAEVEADFTIEPDYYYAIKPVANITGTTSATPTAGDTFGVYVPYLLNSFTADIDFNTALFQFGTDNTIDNIPAGFYAQYTYVNETVGWFQHSYGQNQFNLAAASDICDDYDLICENAESSEYDSDACGTGPCITELSGSPNGDCASGTSVCPLRGTYSIYLPGSSSIQLINETAAANPYYHFLINIDDLPSDTMDFISLRDSGNNELAKLMITFGGGLYVMATGGGSSLADTLSEDTTYHVWFDFVASTGIATLTVGTSRTKSSGASNTSNGTDSANSTNSVIISTSYAANIVVDQILGDDAEITEAAE